MDPLTEVIVLGAGESGVGAALLAKEKGYRVFVSDFGKIKKSYRSELENGGIEFEEGGHDEKRILASGLVIKSPGIPEKAPIVKAIRNKSIRLISEIEWAYGFINGKIVAITGSNGKTTTTSWIYHILDKAGWDVALAGNIGKSLARVVSEKDYEYYVVEISSFQLDDIDAFRPHISVITNITEDHLDRYEYKFENYIRSKMKVAGNQTTADYCIYCLDDPVTNQYINEIKNTNCIPFSWEQTVSEGAFREGDHISFTIKKKPFTMPMREFALAGRHNYFNAMAAGIASRVLGVRKDVIRESLTDFKNLEHRMEFVLTIRGVDFINDSKATNVNSAWFALESMNKNVIWIAGGTDKGNDYDELKDLVRDKVKAIVCLGVDNEKLHKAFAGEVGYIMDTSSMSEAVRMAYNLAGKGEVVLLSPACASFDLFEDYEDRGHQFKRTVRSL
ncbi:MAG: UDP-N-acetylmuramoyl-L-alanine--D-glutamate ligase [Bacteroidetes bacterium]|nr:UDP-N-acetylmuramoyl-L-alanine--D-glutamate ligase [Bacteroidota bacterium]